MDPERPEFALLAARPGAEISAFDCAADGNTLLLGDNEGNVEVADARAPDGAGAAAVNLHDRKLNTLHVSYRRRGCTCVGVCRACWLNRHRTRWLLLSNAPLFVPLLAAMQPHQELSFSW